MDDGALLAEYSIENNDVVLFKNFDEGMNIYKGAWEPENITNFIKVKSIPIVSEFNAKIAGVIFTEGNPALFLFRANQDKAYDNVLKNVAPQI